MYEQLDRMALKSQAEELQRELRAARLAKEAAQREQRQSNKHSIEAGILSVLVNALR